MTKSRDLANAATALNAVTATEIGYVDGVTSAIQTQLNTKQAVVSGVNDTEIGYLDGVTSAIQTQLDAKTAKSTLSTTGDIYYASSANTPARLGIGSTGNVLTVASGIPSWAAPAGGGKVLQVVYATTSTAVNVATTTYTDTGLTATITPTSATSTILVFVNQQGLSAATGQTQLGAGLRLLRAGSAVYTPDNALKYGQQFATGTGLTNTASMMSFAYKDSPATTSSTVYKVQGATNNTAGGGQTIFQESSSASNIVLMEIGA